MLAAKAVFPDLPLKKLLSRRSLVALILGAAAPTGSMVVQLAVVYGKDATKASFYNVMSTVLCVITMPLIILLFQMMFPV